MEIKIDKKTLIIILAFALLLAAVIVMAVLLIGGKESNTAPAAGGLTVDKNAGEYVAAPKQEVEQLPGVAIPGWGSLAIPAGKTEVDGIDLYNPAENDGWYYITFEIRLPDSSAQGYEVLYTSDLVPPGQHIQHITLNRSLEKGEYEATIHVQPYRMNEELTPTNNADMKTVLKVE